MAVTTFSDGLSALETDYSSKNIDWVKYIHDHYQTVFESCKDHTLDINHHFWEHYRMEDFLKSQGYDPNIAWIIFYINQLPSNVEFYEIDSLLLPDMDVIKNLYQSYLQNKSHIKSCRP